MSEFNQTENPILQSGKAHWTVRQAKPIIFIIIALVIAGIYLASTIPISVFPLHRFSPHRYRRGQRRRPDWADAGHCHQTH